MSILRDGKTQNPRARSNLVVLGPGTAGLVSAAGAAALGASVALVEKHLLGGDCLNVGCVPSQAIIRSSRAAHLLIVDRAVLDGETDGFVKILTKRRSDKILGATIVARHAGEMINEISLAMSCGIGLGAISNVIHPYPTQAQRD